MLRGNNCTEAARQQIFRFNPGKELKLFPPKHPYFPKGCGSCSRNGGLNLARKPESEKCRACDAIHKTLHDYQQTSLNEKLRAILTLKGQELTRLLREIVASRYFSKVKGHNGVISAIGENDPDYLPLVACADKAVAHGYNVAILPNPKEIRTPDYIIYNDKFIAAYDVKTISGHNSVGNRLSESVGQTNRVILNMATTYNARPLAMDLRSYFEANKDAVEVLIFKKKDKISITRKQVDNNFERVFMKRYGRKK